jgi:arsenate reductase-like glutaredoxin family protein
MDELREIFAGHDPRDFLSTKSPAFKAMGVDPRKISAEQALKLMGEEPRAIKRPLTAAGKRLIAGFDKEAMRKNFA